MILSLGMKDCLKKAKLDRRKLPNACIVWHLVHSFILISYVNIIISLVPLFREREREREGERAQGWLNYQHDWCNKHESKLVKRYPYKYKRKFLFKTLNVNGWRFIWHVINTFNSNLKHISTIWSIKRHIITDEENVNLKINSR